MRKASDKDMDMIVLNVAEVAENPNALLHKLLLGLITALLACWRAEKNGSWTRITFHFKMPANIAGARVIDVDAILNGVKEQQPVTVQGWGVCTGHLERDYSTQHCECENLFGKPTANYWLETRILIDALRELAFDPNESFPFLEKLIRDCAYLSYDATLLSHNNSLPEAIHHHYGFLDSQSKESEICSCHSQRLHHFLRKTHKAQLLPLAHAENWIVANKIDHFFSRAECND